MEEALEANFSKSIRELVSKSDRHKAADKKAKREITKIEELFQVHDKLLLETIVPIRESFLELDTEFFTGDGPEGLKLWRLLGAPNRQGVYDRPVRGKLTEEDVRPEPVPVESIQGLAQRIDTLQRLVTAVDAKTSDSAVCFAGVQLR